MTSPVNLGNLLPRGSTGNKATVLSKNTILVALFVLYLNMAIAASSVTDTNNTAATVDVNLNNATATTTSNPVALNSSGAPVPPEPTLEPTLEPATESTLESTSDATAQEAPTKDEAPDSSTVSEEPPVDSVTQSPDSTVNSTVIDSGNRTEEASSSDETPARDAGDLSWAPETHNILTTTISPNIRQQQEALSDSGNASANADSNNNSSSHSMNQTIASTSSSSADDADLVDAVSSLTNSSSHKQTGAHVDDEDLLADLAREHDKTEAKSSGGDGLNDLEDSSSNVNVASVTAPQSTLAVTGGGQQQPEKQTRQQQQQLATADQVSEPARIHQVWTASTTSDVDELSPDIISRMQNNVPFLAAYAVRPRIVRASKGPNADNLSTSSSSLVMGRPAATAQSNVDYSEIQVESTSTTSHHHKKQTKLKRKKKADQLAGKALLQKQQTSGSSSRRRKRQQLSLAQKRKMISMASRSLKKRRRRSKSQQQQTNKRATSGSLAGSARRHRKSGRLSRARGKPSRMSLMKRKLNRNNRLYHMNALKYGRYQQQQPEQQGDSGSNKKSVDEDEIASRPQDKMTMANDAVGATKGGATKGGSAGASRKSPFYSGAKRHRDNTVDDDEQADEQAGNALPDRDNKTGEPPLDGDNPEVVSVEPKYDGVDDDPEYFDDGQNTNADRIDDVGEPKPNFDEANQADERTPTSTANRQGDAIADDVADSDERIDGDQGRAARRDREQSQGNNNNSNNNDDDAPTTAMNNGDRNNEDDSLSPDLSHTSDAQGDKTTGGDASAGVGAGIGAATGMDDSVAGMDRSAESDFGNGKDNDTTDTVGTDSDKTRMDEQEQDGNFSNGNSDNNSDSNSNNNDTDNNNSDNDTQDRSLEKSNSGDEVDDKDKHDTGRADKPLTAGDKVDSSNFGMVDNTSNGKRVTGGQAVDDDHLPEGKPMDQGKDLNNFGNKKRPNDADDQPVADGHHMPKDKPGNSEDHHDEHNYDHHDADSHCDHHGHHSHHDTIKWLQDAIPGEPNVDYPILWQVPKTKFNCRDQKYPGYYADVEARCQVFHVCQADGRQDSFLCPNGTIFSQTSSVCVWWNSFDCEDAPNLYERNSLLYKPMTSMRDGQQFNDFMGTFKKNGKRMQNDDSTPESDLMTGRGTASDHTGAGRASAEPTANRFDDEATIQRKSTDLEDDLDIDQKTADLRSGPRRKRRASRQPPKLNPRRKPPTRTAIRRRLRHGAKPRGRKA